MKPLRLTQRVGDISKILILLTVAFFGSIELNAQTPLKGTVKDASSGEPLIGVSILVKGQNAGTVTNLEGNYEIDATAKDTLIFSYVGYDPMVIEASDPKLINLLLLPNSVGLDEVTVTALGIERETKALGYAVQDIDGDELSHVRDANMVNALAGKVAGVQITNGNSGAGSTSRVVIRGESSLTGDNQPLFVIDGIPMNNATDMRTTSGGIAGNMPLDYGNGAAEINPDDIETLTVLKGANATALYGSRAANGAIIITTKSGKGKKGIGVSVGHSTTYETPLASPQYQRVYGQGKNGEFSFVDGYGNGTFDGVDESWGPKMDGRLIAQYDSPTSNGLRGGDVHGLSYTLGASGVDLQRRGEIIPTPWIDHGDPVDQFFETGRTSSTNIALYGSNDKGNFRFSYNNFDNKGMLPNTDLKRNNFALNIGYNLSPKLKVDARANYINSFSNNRAVNSYGTESVMYLFTWLGQQLDFTTLADYWQDGLEGFQQFNYNYNYHDNPYFNMFENTNGLSKNRLLGNVSLSYSILPDLNLMVRGGTDTYSELRDIRRAYSTQRFPRGQYREDKINFQEVNLDFLLNYNKYINNDWFVSASFGGNRMTQKNHFHAVSANQLVIPGVFTFTNTDIPLATSISRPEKQINSLYGLAQVGFKNAIYIDITGRNDWSSTLPDANNSYFYPSVSMSAVLSEMFSFGTDSPVSFAKLRLGWAQVGSDTDPYKLQDPVFFGTAWGSNLTASPSNTLSNQDLKPEILSSYEAGIDVRFFGNRLGLDATYYYTSSENQILAIDIPNTTGYTSRVINAGEITNQGIEVMLNVVPVKSNGFTWESWINFTLNRNKVKRLADGVDRYVLASNRVTLIAEEGQPLGNMYGTGFKEYNGEVIFNKGLPQEDNELRLLGNYNPDFMVGFTNQFSYKGFSVKLLFDWRQGGELMSLTRLIAATAGNIDETLWGRDSDHQGPYPGIAQGGITWEDSDGVTYTDGIIGDGVRYDENTDSYVPNDVIVHASAYHNKRYKRENETEGMYDASYVKLREASISYTLPKKWFGNTSFQNARFSLIGRNLALWSDFNHGDPELLSFTGSGQLVSGVEDMAVPSARSIGFGFNCNF
jgi:TonB-linked SusC/RagA family outer membrane protein